MSTVPRLRALTSLRRFTDPELNVLLGATTTLVASPGDILMKEGEPGRSCLILLEGEVEVLKRVGEVDRVISTLPAGTLLGQVALVERTPRTASIRARTEVTALEFSRDVFEDLLRAQSPLALRFQEQIAIAGARQLRAATESLAAYLELVGANALAPVDALETLRASFDEWGLVVERGSGR